MSRETHVRLLVVVLLGVFAGSLAAVAQSETRMGPFRMSASAGGSYTDNRDSSSDDLKDNDFKIFVSPRLDVIYEDPASLVNFYYAPTWRWRDNPSDTQNEEEWFHDLSLAIDHDLSDRLKGRFREKFDVTDDPAVDAGGTTLRRDSSFILSRTELGGLYQFDRRNSADMSGVYQIKRYDDSEVAKQSDEDQVGGVLRFWRQVAPQLAVIAEARGNMYQYESVESIDRDMSIVYGVVGIERMLAPTTRAGLHAGVGSATYDADEIDSEVAPYAKLFLMADASPTTHLYTEASYMLRDSDVYPFASQEQMLFFAGAAWDASQQLRLGVNGTYRIGDYKEDTLRLAPGQVPAFDTEGQENRFVVVADAVYKLGELTSAKLAYSYEDVDSDVSVTFQRNEVSLSLSRQF